MEERHRRSSFCFMTNICSRRSGPPNCQNIKTFNLGVDKYVFIPYNIDTVREKKKGKRNMTKFQIVWKELNYLVLITLITAQCVVKVDFLIGQFVYLFANSISFTRCFILQRPTADKIKDGCMLGITVGFVAMTALEEFGIHIM